MLRLFQLTYQDREHVISDLEIFCRCIPMDRETGILMDISGLHRRSRALFFQFLKRLLILLHIRKAFFLNLCVFVLDRLRDPGFTKKHIQENTKYRNRHDQDRPSQFVGWIDLFVYDPEHDQNTDDPDRIGNIFRVSCQPPCGDQKPAHLDQKGKRNIKDPVEQKF